MSILKRENYKIFLVYILFGFGGLWHVLNQFQKTMEFLASPLIIAVSLLFLYDTVKFLPPPYRPRFYGWCFFIVCGGWGIEYIGVYTHFPFGQYQYGHVLKPHILQIPLAIGFAWLSICLSSLKITMNIVQQYFKKISHVDTVIPILTGLLMLLFDFLMENAAPKLNYWTWSEDKIPFQNYLTWFFLGLLFSRIWVKLKLPLNLTSPFGIHVYLSQFIYFCLVIFKNNG
jgi:uncharacterized membrane protein